MPWNARALPPAQPWPLVALFTAGYLAAYLLPTTVGRLDSGLPLSSTEAGSIGSPAAGVGLRGLPARRARPPDRPPQARPCRASARRRGIRHGRSQPQHPRGRRGSGGRRVRLRYGDHRRRDRHRRQRDPHRTSTLGLLGVSALAGVIYLTVPRLGPGHGLPLAALALTALLVWPATGRLSTPARIVTTTPVPGTAAACPTPAPDRPRAGILCWSLAQNSLWGVSGRIGLTQAHLTEVTVGAVFAIALGAGLLGVIGAGALGPVSAAPSPSVWAPRSSPAVSHSAPPPRASAPSRPARSPGTRSTRSCCRI